MYLQYLLLHIYPSGAMQSDRAGRLTIVYYGTDCAGAAKPTARAGGRGRLLVGTR